MKLWVGKIQGDDDLWVIDQLDQSSMQGERVWLFRFSLNTWVLVNREEYRKLLQPVTEREEYERGARAYKIKISEIKNPNHQFTDGVSGVIDMGWAGGGSGDCANVRRKFV